MTEIEKAEEPEITERLERLIWKSAGQKSIRKLAEETGLDTAFLLRVRNELIEGVDDLTVRQKRTKLLTNLEEIADKAREDYENEPDKDKGAKLLTVAVGAMKTVLIELNRTAKGEQEAIDRLNSMRVNELLRLIDATVARTLNEIATGHGLDESELLAIFQKHLRPAAEELGQ